MAEKRQGNLFRAMLRLPPHYALLAAALPGFVLFVGSYLLNLDHVMAPARAPFVGPDPRADGVTQFSVREVGYVPALNWSLTYLLLFPAALYFKVTAIQGTARALDHLHRRGMWRNSSNRHVRRQVVTESWIVGNSARAIFIFAFGIVVPVVYSIGEWLQNNLLPLWHGSPPHGWPPAQIPYYDWGLAGVMCQWGLGHRMVNAAFDLVAFADEGLLIASTFIFFLLILDLGRVMPRPPAGSALVLIPDLTAKDVRRGFEVFEEPLQQMLLSALLALVICYLVRLEGLYMNGVGSSSLVEFLSKNSTFDIVGKVFTDPKVLPSLVPTLFNVGPDSFRGVLAWTVSGLISLLCVCVVVMTVRSSANDARASAVEYFATRSEPLFGGSAEEERGRLESMEVWPLRYLRLNLLIGLAVLAFATLYFYRIGIYFVLMGLVALLMRITTLLLSWLKGSDASKEPEARH